MTGELSVLNVGAGDMKFSFNTDDPLELARASRVVKDMLARGYMLFVEVDGKLQRVKRFDEKHHTYVIADGPEAAPSPSAPEEVNEPKARTRRGPQRERRAPARHHNATAVAPTAGG